VTHSSCIAMPSSLAAKLQAELDSRESRLIRRRLPEPTGTLIDFTSNDYLSLSHSPILRSLFLSKLASAPSVLGAGGSRLLVHGDAHTALEARLARFFRAPAALLFNSGFDANVSLFTCLPQPGDVVVYDEFIHASVHDGLRASRATACCAFTHNDMFALRRALEHVKRSKTNETSSVFIAVESVYSMEGTVAPLKKIVEMAEEFFPKGNGYVIVDEAHATGVYGPQGRGIVAMLGLEERVLVRLSTFGKALACTGGAFASLVASSKTDTFQRFCLSISLSRITW
jgi:8-amino-7-oxononanoate synthase